MWILTLFCCLLSSGSVRSAVCVYMCSLLQFWTVCVNCKYVSWEQGNLERMRSLCIINPPYASLLPYGPQEKHFRKGYFIIYIPIVKTGKWSTYMVWGMACSFSVEGKKKPEIQLAGKQSWGSLNQLHLNEVRSEIRTKENLHTTYFFTTIQSILATRGLSCSLLEETYFSELWKLQGKRPNFVFPQQEYWAHCPGPRGILGLQVTII